MRSQKAGKDRLVKGDEFNKTVLNDDDTGI